MVKEALKKSEWISLQAACEFLGLSPNTLRKLVRTGVLPAYEIRGVQGYRLKRADVEALIAPVKVKATKKKK